MRLFTGHLVINLEVQLLNHIFDKISAIYNQIAYVSLIFISCN